MNFGIWPRKIARPEQVVDAYLKLRQEAGVERSDAVAEFVRETAYTWANRLLALRCMEARELIDSVILQQEAYGGRSLEHHRLAQRHPELCAGDDDGLFAVLDKVFREQAARLPMLFDTQAPGIALRPSPAALKDCFGLLSLDPDTLRKYRIRLKEDETASAGAELPNPFTAPDALGWAYQYWNTEEKERVFEKVRTVKGAKIAGADIVPATQLYTEDYMVKFLVQNSLGATWMGMHPRSRLVENWEYYVKDADRAPVERKPVREITFLDPACGSGHFLLEAFDVFYAMYQEEGELTRPEAICDAILTKNLFGIDIDARAVQIAEVALWMKAAERAFDYKGVPTNLVAATASHLKGEAWEEFLSSFQREPSVARVLRKFAQTMEHIDEIGSLARPAEDLREIIREEHATWERQVRERREANFLFPEMRDEALSGRLPFHEISDEEFGERLFYRARASLDAFTEQARSRGDFEDQMLSSETRSGFRLVDLLGRRYDVVAANPPYMGSKNMGAVLKQHMERKFTLGKRDVYAAFILRSLELTRDSGRVSLVTQQSWMFLRSFAELRSKNSDEVGSRGFRGILHGTAIEALAQLGRYAFSEIGNAVVAPVLFAAQAAQPSAAHRLWGCRITAPLPSETQATLLRIAVKGNGLDAECAPHRMTQSRLLDVPDHALLYWVPEDLLHLSGRHPRVVDLSPVRQGLKTSNTLRFVRHYWEVPRRGTRWRRLLRGGGYRKWSGLSKAVIEWRDDGTVVKLHSSEANGGQHWSRNITNTEYYFKKGITYTDFSTGKLSVRYVGDDCVFDAGSPTICIEGQRAFGVMAYLNSRVPMFLARVLSPSFNHLTGVAQVYVSTEISDELSSLGQAVHALKRQVLSRLIDEDCFDPTSVQWESASSEKHVYGRVFLSDFESSVAILLCEGAIEEYVMARVGVGLDSRLYLESELGTPSGWFPLLDKYPEMPSLPDCPNVLLPCFSDYLGQLARRKADDVQLDSLRANVRSLFEAGTGVNVELEEGANESSGEDDEESSVGSRIPIPAESLIEEISQRLELHPISVVSLKNSTINEQIHYI